MKYNGFYVAGAGGSGTVLTSRLFASFDDVHVLEGEMRLPPFVRRMESEGKRCCVAKTGNSIFSAEAMDPHEMTRQLEMIRDNKIGVIFVMRDFYSLRAQNAERYLRCYGDMIKYWQYVQYVVSYYRILEEPDVVQKEIAEVFDLEIEHLFSEYPDFYKPDKPVQEDGRHSLRRLGASYKEG